MSNGPISISEISELDGVRGQRILVSAVLVLRGRECFLVPDFTLPLSEDKVCLFHPGLEELLDCAVGGWVGGPASYFDLVIVEGVVRDPTARRDIASISDISRLSLIREDEIYEVIG